MRKKKKEEKARRGTSGGDGRLGGKSGGKGGEGGSPERTSPLPRSARRVLLSGIMAKFLRVIIPRPCMRADNPLEHDHARRGKMAVVSICVVVRRGSWMTSDFAEVDRSRGTSGVCGRSGETRSWSQEGAGIVWDFGTDRILLWILLFARLGFVPRDRFRVFCRVEWDISLLRLMWCFFWNFCAPDVISSLDSFVGLLI